MATLAVLQDLIRDAQEVSEIRFSYIKKRLKKRVKFTSPIMLPLHTILTMKSIHLE